MKSYFLKYTALILGVLLSSILLISCAVSSKVQDNVTYVSPDFSKSSLERQGLALLPIVAGSGVEGYRRPFGEAMNNVADSAISNFMSWKTTYDKLNEAELVSSYNSAIKSYNQTGIIDQSILNKMAEVTGQNYFFFVRLAPPTSDTDMNYDYFSGTYTTTQTKSVTANGLVWSASEGDVVWEGSATAEVTTGNYSYTEETDMDRAKKVAKSLMSSLL